MFATQHDLIPSVVFVHVLCDKRPSHSCAGHLGIGSDNIGRPLVHFDTIRKGQVLPPNTVDWALEFIEEEASGLVVYQETEDEM
jgi:hypothetical protein